MEQTTLFDVLVREGVRSPAMWMLGLCSFITCVVVFERIWFFFGVSKGLGGVELTSQVLKALANRDAVRARLLCQESESAMARVLRPVLDERAGSSSNRHEILRRAIEREVMLMERYIGVLGTIGNVTPYVGLFGTVLGVMHAFQELGASGASGPSVVMRGLSEALIATAVGLFVAIMAVIGYNYFIRRIKRTVKELQVYGVDVADQAGLP